MDNGLTILAGARTVRPLIPKENPRYLARGVDVRAHMRYIPLRDRRKSTPSGTRLAPLTPGVLLFRRFRAFARFCLCGNLRLERSLAAPLKSADHIVHLDLELCQLWLQDRHGAL